MKKRLLTFILIAGALSLSAQDTPQGERITYKADSFTHYQEQSYSHLEGNAQIKSEDFTINGDVIDVFSSAAQTGENQLDTIVANGKVKAVSDDITILSDTMDYDHASRVAIFRGEVTAEQGSNEVRGEELEINFDTGIYKMRGPVRGVLGGGS